MTTLCLSGIRRVNADSSCLFLNATWGQELETSMRAFGNTILVNNNLLKSKVLDRQNNMYYVSVPFMIYLYSPLTTVLVQSHKE